MVRYIGLPPGVERDLMWASSICLAVWCQTVWDWAGKPCVFSTMVFMSCIEVLSFTVLHMVGPCGGVMITSHSVMFVPLVGSASVVSFGTSLSVLILDSVLVLDSVELLKWSLIVTIISAILVGIAQSLAAAFCSVKSFVVLT